MDEMLKYELLFGKAKAGTLVFKRRKQNFHRARGVEQVQLKLQVMLQIGLIVKKNKLRISYENLEFSYWQYFNALYFFIMRTGNKFSDIYAL